MPLSHPSVQLILCVLLVKIITFVAEGLVFFLLIYSLHLGKSHFLLVQVYSLKQRPGEKFVAFKYLFLDLLPLNVFIKSSC